jgi:vacuole morphology and inheritance protein 14
MANLADTEEADVLKLNIEVLARTAAQDVSFLRTHILVGLVRLFADNRPLLESKGSFIVRRLCLLLDPRVIYVALSRTLLHTANREFASLLVELLNLILLTAIELSELREEIRGCAADAGLVAALEAEAQAASTAVAAPVGGEADWATEELTPVAVFATLYRTWCANPVATFSLCLLAQAYKLGSWIVGRFAETTISVGVLMQIDKLVQLLESPIFLHMRMHLTQPGRPDHIHLLQSLFGLLMVLPQGTAYATLKDRLHSVTSLHLALLQQQLAGADAGALSVANGAGAMSGLRALASGGTGVAFYGNTSPPKPIQKDGNDDHGASPQSLLRPTGALDIDAAFAVFEATQKRSRDALANDIRGRSLLPAKTFN